jgi:hypothetical protein
MNPIAIALKWRGFTVALKGHGFTVALKVHGFSLALKGRGFNRAIRLAIKRLGFSVCGKTPSVKRFVSVRQLPL